MGSARARMAALGGLVAGTAWAAGCSGDETTTVATTTAPTGAATGAGAGGMAGTGGTATGSAGSGATGPSCTVTDLAFDHQVIDDDGPTDVWQKIVGDLDGDGHVDLIAGGRTSGGLLWYESPSWTSHEIAPGGGHSTDGEVIDVDGDGDLDVVSVTTTGLVWYENPDFTEHAIDTRDLHDVEVADLDGDGDADAVARNQGEFGHSGNALHFYEQQSPTSWSHRAVTIPDGEGVVLADLDGDQDADVVIPSRWYENSGDIGGGAWTEHEYTSAWTHPNGFVATGDMNGDGRLDVVLSPSELAGETYRIAWYEAPDDPTAAGWLEHVIESDVEAVHHFVGVADFTGDGALDVASAEMHQGADPDEVKVFINGGDGSTWTKVVLASTGSHSMRIVDANEDGFPDLFGANHSGQLVELWTHRGCTR